MVPPPSALGNYFEFDTNPQDPSLANPLDVQVSINPKDIPPVTIGASFPPVPGKLVKRIKASNFIKMGELLPKWLGAANFGIDDDGF